MDDTIETEMVKAQANAMHVAINDAVERFANWHSRRPVGLSKMRIIAYPATERGGEWRAHAIIKAEVIV